MEYTYLGFIITLFGVLMIFATGKIDYLSPFSLHVLSWFILFTGGIFAGEIFYPLTGKVFLMFFIWYIIIGSITLLMYIIQNKDRSKKIIISEYSLKFKNLFFIFSLISCLISIMEIYYVGSSGPYDFFINLRLSLFLEDYSGPRYVFTPILYLIMTSLFAISLISNNTKTLAKVLIVWQLIFVISTVGKLAVLTPVIIFFVIKYIGFKKKIKLRSIGLFIGFFAITSFALTILRTSENSDKQNLFEILGIYTYSPIIAFGEISQNSENFGEHIFRFFYALSYRIGLSNIEPVDTINDYVYIPFPTNVYTIMQPFYQDFDVFGIFYGAIFYGLFYSLMYFKAIQRQGIYIVFYSYISLNLLFGFFGETLLTNLSLSLYLFIVTGFIWRFCVVKN